MLHSYTKAARQIDTHRFAQAEHTHAICSHDARKRGGQTWAKRKVEGKAVFSKVVGPSCTALG